MKYVWEESDVVPGLRVFKPTSNHKESIIIIDNRISTPNRFGIVSLTDGSCFAINEPKHKIADVLNEYKFSPFPFDK